MVEIRDGDEVDLLDSSLRTAGGAVFSTTLYVLTGIIYAFVTDPAATGRYFFAAIGIALLLRPVRGISQTLQKIGSERGESVRAYFGLTIGFTAVYLALGGGATLLASDIVVRETAVSRALLLPAAVLALSTAASVVTDSLFGAVGYPSFQTWLNAGQSTIRLTILLLANPLVTTAGDIMLIVAATRGLTLVPALLYVGTRPTMPTRHHLDRAWAFARWSIPDQILDRFSYNMPTLVLGVVATPAAVGVYEAADRFADLGATISWRLASPLLTKVSGDAAAGEEAFEYLGGAITGGTGVTFLVLGYILATDEVVAEIAFPSLPGVFSTTVLIVGTVNILRGFWTLLSHAIEAVGRPELSFRTKLYGLVCSTPIPVVFGAEYGAVAGAAGYAVMNVAVFALVVYYARVTFDRVPRDLPLTARLTVALLAATVGTAGATEILVRIGAGPVAVAVAGAGVCLCLFLAVLFAVSGRSRFVARRVYRLTIR